MKKTNQINKIYKKILFIGILAYLLYVFIGQEKTIRVYKNEQNFYKNQIEQQLAYQKSLYETKANIDSEERIEKVAREKLDMYLPNERVYIDNGK